MIPAMVRWLAFALLATGCSTTSPTATPAAHATTAVTATPVAPPIAARPSPAPALPKLTRETFDQVVEETLATVFDTCTAGKPTKRGDHSVEVTLLLRPNRDPDVEAPVALPHPDPALEDCLVDQLVQLELPAFPITGELSFTYKIKDRADGSRIRIFGTMEIVAPLQSS